MKFTKHMIFVAVAGLAFTACGDDDDKPGDSPDASVADADAAVEIPSIPALGVQIDRIGRPAIGTALMETFNGDETAKGIAKDGYNAEGIRSSWASYATNFAGSLAILDSLDTVCGNQFGADLASPRYSGLAGLFADDQLYVNADSGDCTQYLGVEVDALGVIPNDFCGGRTLTMDIIDTSYSALAAGVLTGVDDTITEDADCAQSLTAFPFVCAPL